VTQLAWQTSASHVARTREPVITLDLTNASAATVELAAAGVTPGQPYMVQITTDGPVTLTLGTATVHVPPGKSTLTEPGPAAAA
jgi:hypothetical protein